MGLDMYLTGSKFLWTDERNDGIGKDINKLLGHDFPISNIEFELGYWRKANQIHKWFVDNVQDGIDECDKTYVSTEELESLLDDVKSVLADNSLADKLLPTQGGFFFGNTDYDEYYFSDLENTKEIIEVVLKFKESKEGKDLDIYYRSSW